MNVAYISCIIHFAIFALYCCGLEEGDSWVSQYDGGAGRYIRQTVTRWCRATAIPCDCRDGRRDVVRQRGRPTDGHWAAAESRTTAVPCYSEDGHMPGRATASDGRPVVPCDITDVTSRRSAIAGPDGSQTVRRSCATWKTEISHAVRQQGRTLRRRATGMGDQERGRQDEDGVRQV